MITKKILRLVEEKYGKTYFIIIFPDESGRITDDYQSPYRSVPAYEFSNLQQLTTHLKGNTHE